MSMMSARIVRKACSENSTRDLSAESPACCKIAREKKWQPKRRSPRHKTTSNEHLGNYGEIERKCFFQSDSSGLRKRSFAAQRSEAQADFISLFLSMNQSF